MRAEEVRDAHPDLWTPWCRLRADDAVPGSESVRAFHRRRVTTTVRVLAEAHRGRTLVVTHGGALDMLWRAVQSLPLDGPRDCAIPNCGMNRLRWSPDERLLILQ